MVSTGPDVTKVLTRKKTYTGKQLKTNTGARALNVPSLIPPAGVLQADYSTTVSSRFCRPADFERFIR